MTNDDDELSRALRDAAAAIDPPPGGRDAILQAAQERASEQRTFPGSLVPSRRRSRITLAAAAMVLISFGISLSFLTLTSAPTERPVVGALAVPSTTIPIGFSGAGLPATKTSTQLDIAGDGERVTSGSSNGAISPTSGSGELASKVVAVGTVRLTVPDGRVQSTVTALSVLVVRDDGYVASSQVHVGTGSTARSSGLITLRVPEAQFAAVVRQVQRFGTVTSVRTTSTDVTSQYVDLGAQIAALQEGRRQYLSIMARATSINDILAIQAQINTIQSQIDQLEGARNVLDNQASYGTLTVALTPEGQQPLGIAHAASGLSTAWHDSIRGFVLGVEWLIRIAGPLVFVLLCLLALLLLGRVAWRASRRRLL